MGTIEESVVIAMDGSDTGIFPFLPFILQDLWEIGSLKCSGIIPDDNFVHGKGRLIV